MNWQWACTAYKPQELGPLGQLGLQDAVNVPLSEKRAAAVKDYLVRKGLKDGQIESRGFGAAKPVAVLADPVVLEKSA